MKLSSETLIGLKRLCSPTLVPENNFRSIVHDASLAVLTSSVASKQIPNDQKLDLMKTTYASLIVLLIEAARYGLNSNMLRNTLEGYNSNLDRINYIVETYEKNRSGIESRLSNIGTALPHIVAVHWRLDYCLGASRNRQNFSPLFHIEFVTMVSNEEKIVRFACTLQNLEELLFSLKNAIRHINKLITS